MGFVPWDQVVAIRAVTVASQTMVAVELRQPELIVSRLRGWKRFPIAINQRISTGDVFIPASVLPTSATDFASLMEEWRRG